jgi:hypothetical protein
MKFLPSSERSPGRHNKAKKALVLCYKNQKLTEQPNVHHPPCPWHETPTLSNRIPFIKLMPFKKLTKKEKTGEELEKKNPREG